MKKAILAVSLLALTGAFHSSVIAANSHAAGPDSAHEHTALPQTMADGVVKRVDRAGGKVTISHGPLESLGMPAMTMSYKLREARWLDRMKAGDRIRFVAEDIDGALTLVRFEPAR